jgi:hypothetical protein
LLFANGKRLTSRGCYKGSIEDREFLRFEYDRKMGWKKLGWISDNDIEWEGVETDRRWRDESES